MAVSPIVIKAIATAATDKRTWQAIAVVIAAILTPIIIAVMMICALFSGTETANNNLLDYSFAGTEIPKEFTDEQREAIEDMVDWLEILDNKIENSRGSLDNELVRAAFYCLNFGGSLGKDFDFDIFCECFENVDYEQLETALQNVSDQFPQYEITGKIVYSIEKVYEYLTGEAA